MSAIAMGLCVIDPAGNPIVESVSVTHGRCWVGAGIKILRKWSTERAPHDILALQAKGYRLVRCCITAEAGEVVTQPVLPGLGPPEAHA